MFMGEKDLGHVVVESMMPGEHQRLADLDGVGRAGRRNGVGTGKEA
jgi:hypothetical protein